MARAADTYRGNKRRAKKLEKERTRPARLAAEEERIAERKALRFEVGTPTLAEISQTKTDKSG
jgi:hypothetical protein